MPLQPPHLAISPKSSCFTTLSSRRRTDDTLFPELLLDVDVRFSGPPASSTISSPVGVGERSVSRTSAGGARWSPGRCRPELLPASLCRLGMRLQLVCGFCPSALLPDVALQRLTEAVWLFTRAACTALGVCTVSSCWCSLNVTPLASRRLLLTVRLLRKEPRVTLSGSLLASLELAKLRASFLPISLIFSSSKAASSLYTEEATLSRLDQNVSAW